MQGRRYRERVSGKEFQGKRYRGKSYREYLNKCKIEEWEKYLIIIYGT